MPVLQDVRTTKTIKSIAIEGGEITAYTSFLARDIEKMQGMEKNMIAGIVFLIKDWNFTDEDGKKLEINEENVRLLDIRDIKELNKVIEEMGFLENSTEKASN